MQEFTTKIKGLTKGLRPTEMQRTTGMLVECLNLKPMPGDKLVAHVPLNFPPFMDTLSINADPIARADYYYIYVDETATGNVLENDTDWGAQSMTVTAVNGDSDAVGEWVTVDALGSQARIMVNGDFEFTPSEDYELEYDEFENITLSYTATAGDDDVTATVYVRIQGRPIVEEDPGGGGDDDDPPTGMSIPILFNASDYASESNLIVDSGGTALSYDIFSFSSWQFESTIVPAKVLDQSGVLYCLFAFDGEPYRRASYVDLGVLDLSGEFCFDFFVRPTAYGSWSLGQLGAHGDIAIIYDNYGLRFGLTHYCEWSWSSYAIPYAHIAFRRIGTNFEILAEGSVIYQVEDLTDYSNTVFIGSSARDDSYTVSAQPSLMAAWRLSIGGVPYTDATAPTLPLAGV